MGPRANGGGSNGTPSRRLSLNANGARSASKDGKKESNRLSAPLNYVAIAKEDAASHVSGGDPVPASPWRKICLGSVIGIYVGVFIVCLVVELNKYVMQSRVFVIVAYKELRFFFSFVLNGGKA